MQLSLKTRFFLKYILISILVLTGCLLHFFNLNWDQNSHLHPDERFLTMVTTDLVWPKTWLEYFDTQRSSLNPNNVGHEFFVYGTWPLILTKFSAEKLNLYTYEGVTQVGRALSASADLLTFFLIIIITAKLVPKYKFISGFIAGLFYLLMVPAIQQAHFFTTDTFLVFALTVSFYFCLLKPNWLTASLVGSFFALAVAAKISGGLFGPILGLMIISNWIKTKSSWPKISSYILIAGLFFGLTLRVVYPSLFQSQNFIPTGLNQDLLANWHSLKGYEGRDTQFPPGLQWIPFVDSPYLPIQFLCWGIGLPITLLLIFAMASNSWKKLKISWIHPVTIILLWIIGLIVYQSLQFPKTLRYLFPILPFIAIIGGFFLQNFSEYKTLKKSLVLGLFLAAVFWLKGFFQIYLQPHTRIAASEWIFDNIPTGSTLTYEYWDDALPIPLKDRTSNYQILELHLTDPEDFNKWSIISKQIADADYIVLSSNRLWRSVSALPERFPETARYYQKLFNGSLGFSLVAQFTNYPCLIPGDSQIKIPNLQPKTWEFTQTFNCKLAIANDGAEEALTVYDHPTVLIFKNEGHFSSDKLLRLIKNLVVK